MDRELEQGNELLFPDALQKCQDITRELLEFPLIGLKSYEIFSQDGIVLFKELAEQVEYGRRKRNWGVVGGAITNVIGAGLAIAGGILTPFTFGGGIALLVAGGGVSMAGVGINAGFILDKYFADKDRAKLAENVLQKFIIFQRDLASAVSIIHITSEVISAQQSIGITIRGEVDEQVKGQLLQLKTNLQSLRERASELSIHQLIHEISTLVKKLSEEVFVGVVQPIKKALGAEELQFEKKIILAKEKPFEMLIPAIKSLCEESSANKTFFSLVREFYEKLTVDESTDELIFPAGVHVDESNNQLVQLRESHQEPDICQHDATSRITANVLRVAKVVSLAGIILKRFGLEVNVGFLGLAEYDLLQKDNAQFSQALDEVSGVMLELNRLCGECFVNQS